jgi:hypothetical protein
VDKDVISHGTKQLSFMDALLRSMQERRFDKLDAEETDSIKIEAKLAKAEADAAISSATSKAYRLAVSQQAEIVALLTGAFVRCTASLSIESRTLTKAIADKEGNYEEFLRVVEKIAKGMSEVARSNDTVLASLGGISGKIGNVPGLYDSPPSGRPSGRMSVAGRPATASTLGTATKAQRFVRRPSVAGNLSSLTSARPSAEPTLSALKASPAVRRVLSNPVSRHLADSPRRLIGSPRKRPTAVQLALRAKKQVAWNSPIDDKATAAQPSPLSTSSSADLASSSDDKPSTPEAEDENGEWEDAEQEDVGDDSSPKDGLAAKKGFAGGDLDLKPPAPTFEGWKAHRALMGMGRASRTLGEVSEEAAESSASDGSSPNTQTKVLKHPRVMGLMGPPQRPIRPPGDVGVTLGDSQRMPPPPSSATRPTSFSLFASSSSASAGPCRPGITSSPNRPSPRKQASRRVSSIGPVRSERKRSRTSILPSVAEDGGLAGILAQNMSPRQVGVGNTSASHSRMSFAGMGRDSPGGKGSKAYPTGKSPKKGMRRSSSIGVASGGSKAPRASISGLTRLPSSLAMTSNPTNTSPKTTTTTTSTGGFAAPTASSAAAAAATKALTSSALKVSPLASATVAPGPRTVPPSLRKIQSMYGLGAATGAEGVAGAAGARPIWK